MDSGLERRLSGYEPIFKSWYVESFMWEDSSGEMFSLRDTNGRKGAVRVLTVDSRRSDKSLSELTAAAVKRINARIPLAGEAFLVTVRNFSVKNHENIGGRPMAADILVLTDEYKPLSSLTSKGQMPYITARKLADNLCRGIRCAHKAGFYFGDICPENIRLDSEEHFCLDAPCTYSPDTADLTYAAPETLDGLYDPVRADIYSYGLVLYQLFNGGLLPLQKRGEDPMISVKARLNGAAFDPPAGAPPEFGRFIMQCVMTHPESRYPSMDEVYRVLGQLTVDSVPAEYESCYCCPPITKRHVTRNMLNSDRPARTGNSETEQIKMIQQSIQKNTQQAFRQSYPQQAFPQERSVPVRQQAERYPEDRARQYNEHHAERRTEHYPEHHEHRGYPERHRADPPEEKESKRMKMYVMVLLYMLLMAGSAFLVYSIFFIK